MNESFKRKLAAILSADVTELKTVLMTQSGNPYPICASYMNYFGVETEP
jgi:hypothetical protein